MENSSEKMYINFQSFLVVVKSFQILTDSYIQNKVGFITVKKERLTNKSIKNIVWSSYTKRAITLINSIFSKAFLYSLYYIPLFNINEVKSFLKLLNNCLKRLDDFCIYNSLLRVIRVKVRLYQTRENENTCMFMQVQYNYEKIEFV